MRRCTKDRLPHEATVVAQPLAETFIAEPVTRLVGGNTYDSGHLDQNSLKPESQ